MRGFPRTPIGGRRLVRVSRARSAVHMVAALWISLAVWNVVVFCCYAFDKRRAKRGGRRVSEKRLLLLLWLCAPIGAALGMRILRHKTRKKSFLVKATLLFVLNPLWLVVVWQAGWLPSM